jgi:hypothetical protein
MSAHVVGIVKTSGTALGLAEAVSLGVAVLVDAASVGSIVGLLHALRARLRLNPTTVTTIADLRRIMGPLSL